MIIEVENLSKLYRLGSIGSTTLQESLNRRWYRLIGKEELGRRIGVKDLMIPPDHPQAGPEPNTFWALKDVSFTVEQGDIVGIIGRNGAGKSTLLKVLTRITEPTSGRAVLRGRVGSLLEVGTGFHPELSGRENIFLNGAILGMRRREIERKFDEIVAFAEVERFIDTPVKRYSSGMYVRLAFAVAAHLDPEILLVDEVLAVGDAAFQKKCLGKMKDVAGEGRTVLFVSHSMAAVEHLCPTSVWLEHGRVRENGLTGQVVGGYIESGENRNEAEKKDGSKRPGTGSARVSTVEFLTADGRPTASFRSGHSWTASVRYRVLRPLIQPHFKVTIYSHMGVPVANMGTRISGVSTSRQDEAGVFTCTLPELMLVPGSYRVNVGIMDRDEIVDACEYAGHFAVQGGNPLGSGLFPEVGSIIVHPVWECHGAPSSGVLHTPAAGHAKPQD